MSRAYLVYFVMFAALVGGMTLIMTMGESVRAPDDLSGEWAVEWDNAPPPESGEPTMKVAQSGRFFVVTFGQSAPISLALQDGWTGKSKGRWLDMTLADDAWKLHLSGNIPPKQRWQVPELKLELTGPTRHYGIARRVFAATEEQEATGPRRADAVVVPSDVAPPDAVPAPPTTRPAPSDPPTAHPAPAAVPAETAHAR